MDDTSKLESEMRQAMTTINEAVAAMEPDVSSRAMAAAMIRLAAFMFAAGATPAEEFMRLCQLQNRDAQAFEAGRRRPPGSPLH